MIDYLVLESEAPQGHFSQWDMEVLIPEVQKLKPGQIYLEIGVMKGRSLWVARKFAHPKVKVCGIDLDFDPKIPGTIFTQGDSRKLADGQIAKIGLLFIDGDHTYEGVQGDLQAWYPHMKDNGVILFHDADETGPGVVWAMAEFCYKNHKFFNMFKKTDKNTSMAKIQL